LGTHIEQVFRDFDEFYPSRITQSSSISSVIICLSPSSTTITKIIWDVNLLGSMNLNWANFI